MQNRLSFLKSGTTIECRRLLIDQDKLNLIRKCIKRNWDKGRTAASLELCERLNFFQPNGRPKDRAMRQILNFLEEKNLVRLPQKKRTPNNRLRRTHNPNVECRIDVSTISAIDLNQLKLVQATSKFERFTWNILVEKYHYLGRKHIVGRNLKQIVFYNDRPVALLGWGDASLRLAPRQNYLSDRLGSDECGVNFGVNNCRFLIPPWVKVKNLASKSLSLALRDVRNHWKNNYYARLKWAETFVDPTKFAGTCYLAANWQMVGYTKGTSRQGYSARRINHGNKKKILVYTY